MSGAHQAPIALRDRILRWPRSMQPEDWGAFYFKAAVLAWMVALRVVTPEKVFVALEEPLLSLWTITAMWGAFVSLIGLVMTAQRWSRRVSVAGFTIELSGLLVLAIGPVVYFTTQVGIMAQNPDELQGRFALSFLAHAMVAALVARFVVVIVRRRRVVRSWT